ncbi:hypothetical protein Ancab_001203 [Ancistrocladus abbreviatus]
MSKEFNVHSAVFPSGGSPALPPPPQRRTPMTPCPANPSIPFTSLDIGAAAAASMATTSSFSAPSFSDRIGNFDDEPPLLEELGIKSKEIYSKRVSVLNPFRVKANLHDNADLSGPLHLLVALGTLFCQKTLLQWQL